MQLEAGPIPPLDTSWYPTTYDQPDFLEMVYAAWAEIDQVTAEMDALIDPVAVFDEVLTGDTILADLDTVDQINGDNAYLSNLAPMANIDGMKLNGDTALIFAVQSIPGEAFATVPPVTAYGTIAQPAPTATFAGVTLVDTATNSGTDLHTGDQYQIQVKMSTATGKAADYYGVKVWGEMFQDGAPRPHLDLGTTDGAGVVTYKGQWQTADAGNWTMYLHADPLTGGEVVSQVYQWSVVDRSQALGGRKPQAVTVQLKNWTTGDINNSHVGDHWQLFVTGPPRAAVYLYSSQNGAQQTERQIGTTDPAGNFTVADAWTAADSGAWVEYYAVGRLLWDGWLTFNVQP